MKKFLVPYIAAALAFSIAALSVCAANHQRKPTARPKEKPAPKKETGYPIEVINVRIGSHRVTERVCTLEFKNVDAVRSISKIKWWVTAYAPLTKRLTASNLSFEAEPLTSVKTNEVGSATDLLDNFFPETLCSMYQPKKENGPNGAFFQFFPSRCTGDYLLIDVRKVQFSDGSIWRAPDS